MTLLNTGEFYGGGESEMVLREALAGVSRDRYFLSVKFGVLPQPGGGIYGLDVKPWNVKAHLAYSLANRNIETNGILDVARKYNMNILAFSVLQHGLLSDNSSAGAGRPGMPQEVKEAILSGIREIAGEKKTSVENLLQAYVYAKNPDMSILIGTTRKEHLQDSINALSVELSAEDIKWIETVFPAEQLQGKGMRSFIFRDGRMEM